MQTLVTDGFEENTPEAAPQPKATGLHHIVYGKDSYLDDLDEAVIDALLVTAVIRLVTEVAYPGGRTRIYASMEGNLPKAFQ